MAQSISALVEPSVLRWARESIGLTEVAAARKIGSIPDDRVAQWEAGEASPTVAQLRRAAAVYKRPLAVFFLAEPPRQFDAMRDFRRHVGSAAGEWSPELHGEYRRALRQREHLLELAEIEETPIPSAWRKEPSAGDAESLGALARRVLLESSPVAPPSTSRNTAIYDHLNAWIAGLEEAGVMVLATGGGGVSTSEMRAFSLYFDELPVIVVNGSDYPRGRLFSLLHEYAHFLLHTGGLCDITTDASTTSPNRRVEARCNAIAAAALMPAEAVEERLRRFGSPPSGQWDYESLRDAADPFGVSAEAFLRRLVTLGHVPMPYYEEQRQHFLEAYEQESASKPSGGNWYRNTARDLGKAYVRRIASAHSRRVIDSFTAAAFLNVKVGQIQKLSEAAALKAPV